MKLTDNRIRIIAGGDWRTDNEETLAMAREIQELRSAMYAQLSPTSQAEDPGVSDKGDGDDLTDRINTCEERVTDLRRCAQVQGSSLQATELEQLAAPIAEYNDPILPAKIRVALDILQMVPDPTKDVLRSGCEAPRHPTIHQQAQRVLNEFMGYDYSPLWIPAAETCPVVADEVCSYCLAQPVNGKVQHLPGCANPLHRVKTQADALRADDKEAEQPRRTDYIIISLDRDPGGIVEDLEKTGAYLTQAQYRRFLDNLKQAISLIEGCAGE